MQQSNGVGRGSADLNINHSRFPCFFFQTLTSKFSGFHGSKGMILIYHLAENGFIDACISSRVRPLVSGTSFATNRTVKQQMAENMKNVPVKL